MQTRQKLPQVLRKHGDALWRAGKIVADPIDRGDQIALALVGQGGVGFELIENLGERGIGLFNHHSIPSTACDIDVLALPALR